MATTPTPTKTAGTTPDMSGFGAISGSAATNPNSWTAARSATGDYSGLGIPNATKLTGDQAFTAIEQLALRNPSAWGQLRPWLVAMGAYGDPRKPISFHKNWTSRDVKAVENAIAYYHVNNMPDPNAPAGVTSTSTPFLSFAMNTAKTNAVEGNAMTQLRIQNVTVPNTLDLNHIADAAFRSAIGRPPTAQEQSRFASAYQTQVKAVAGANAINSAQTMQANNQLLYGTPALTTPAPTTLPVQSGAQALGAASTPPPNVSSMPSAPSIVPTAVAPSVNFKQDVPNAQVAAIDFARKSDPAGAASENVSNALDAMFNVLARNSR